MHEYFKRLSIALGLGILDAGTVNHALIFHDNWCGIHEKNECNCNPDIIIQTPTGQMKVQKDGTIQGIA
mgnify:CR=1 FL=1